MLKIKAINKTKGFTKEQSKYIAETILKEINRNININEISKIIKENYQNDVKLAMKSNLQYHLHNLYLENITNDILIIKLPDCNFKVEILNTLPCLINYLNKIHVMLDSEYIEEEEEKTKEDKINSEFMKAENEEIKHVNYVTNKEYNNKNIEILENAMKQYNYVDSAWLGSYQAKKVKLQLKKINHPVMIQVYIPSDKENEKPHYYLENVYNIADFEEMQKIEETSDFKDIVNRLKSA